MKYFLYFTVNSTLYKDCSGIIIINLAGSFLFIALILGISALPDFEYHFSEMDKIYGRCMFSPISYSSIQAIQFNSLKHTPSSLLPLPLLSLVLYMHFFTTR